MSRFLRFVFVLILFQVGVLAHVKGQGCNLETTVVIGFACSAVTSVGYENGIDCYSEIRMILEEGSYYSWTANDADGWIVEQLAPNELLITHVNGTFPSGDHTMVDFLYYTPGGGATQLILLYPDECVLEGCENQHMLPGCGEGCISGTVYRECADEPLTDQPTLDGFIVELSDDMGNIVNEYTTIADGVYSFCDLPPGNYIVRASKSPGWSPSVPASGMYAMELTPGSEAFRNFGSCPECSCDDFEVFLQQEPGTGDTSYLNISVAKNNPFCLERYEISIDSGEIVQIEVLTNGWEGELLDGQHAAFNRVSMNSDWTAFVFHRLTINHYGIKEKGIKSLLITNGDGNQPPEPLCQDSIILEHPTKYKQFTCCPDGSSLGAELVVNGEFFVVQSPATDYSFLPYPNLPGEIAIVNNVISPFWLQTSKNGGPFDNFLAVNGSATPGLAVWKQQVTGFLGGENYNFCGLFNNLFRSNQNADDPVIELIIQDDNSLFNWTSGLIVLPENPDLWEKFSLAWTVPVVPASSYTLKIISHGTNPFGNDFGVDCISFRECITPQDSCCKDLQAFCDDLEAGIIFAEDSCKVTMDLSALPPCYLIEWVDWGQGPEFGPWTPTTLPRPMHSFSGPGTYPISYLAIAYNDSNFICLEKVLQDTITVDCGDCIEDFETGSLGQWQGLSGQVSIITDPITGTMVLKGNDNQGASWMYNNSSDYNGDWTQKFNNCLCFDIRYDNGDPSNPSSGTSALTIYQGSDPLNFSNRATFVVNTPIGNSWTRVCVPVGLSNGTTYPSNQYGQWTSTSFSDFDMVIQGVSGIGIPLDFAGGSSPSEMVFVDNFCVEKCMDCICNVPNMSITTNLESFQLFCSQGAPTPSLPCPASDVVITGFFGCEMASGELCEETSVHYVLTGPNGIVDQGTTTPFPSLTYTVSQIGAPGTYALTLSTLCPGQTDSCVCTVRWVQEVCDTCYCGGFEDMFVRTPQGAMNMAVACGDQPLIIPCPDPGKGFHLTGVFGCAGGACPPDHQIDWSLVHQSTGTTHSGSFQDNDPFFGIHILPTYISQPGIYTLTLTGYCNGDTCVCEVQFIIDCPDLCPCDIEDVVALSANVDKGFAVALANKTCKACFSPLAVSDCETVEWYVNNTSGTPIGNSIGSQTFCYTFPFSGTYTIYMVVTRLKPDGTLCEAFVYSRTITVSCLKGPICVDSVFPNPGFGEGAIGGLMGAGGEAPGWIGEGEHPTVLEGVAESDDAWSILLTGCYFNSDVLTSNEPVCLSKTDTGTISIRLRTPGDPIPGVDVKLGRKPPGGNSLHIQFRAKKDLGDNDCEKGEKCRQVAIIEDLLPIEDDDWYDLYIPYDLNNWESEDSCGDLSAGLPVHLKMWMSNMLSSDQGDGKVRDGIILDQICMDGDLVGTNNPRSPIGYRLFPNPTIGAFRLEIPNPAGPNTRLHITGLTGQVLLDQIIPEGSSNHEVDASALAPGMYFVEVLHQGQRQAVFKVVKQ